MRFKTALIAGIIGAMTSLLPGIISGKLLTAVLVGSICSFLVSYMSYSYRDPINDSPIDLGSVIAGNLAGAFFSSITVSSGYWQAFWLTGLSVVTALLIGALCIFSISRLFTSSAREAVEFSEDLLKLRQR